MHLQTTILSNLKKLAYHELSPELVIVKKLIVVVVILSYWKAENTCNRSDFTINFLIFISTKIRKSKGTMSLSYTAMSVW